MGDRDSLSGWEDVPDPNLDPEVGAVDRRVRERPRPVWTRPRAKTVIQGLVGLASVGMLLLGGLVAAGARVGGYTWGGAMVLGGLFWSCALALFLVLLGVRYWSQSWAKVAGMVGLLGVAAWLWMAAVSFELG